MGLFKKLRFPKNPERNFWLINFQNFRGHFQKKYWAFPTRFFPFFNKNKLPFTRDPEQGIIFVGNYGGLREVFLGKNLKKKGCLETEGFGSYRLCGFFLYFIGLQVFNFLLKPGQGGFELRGKKN